MCNLYSQSRSRDEIRRLFRVEHDLADNLPPQPCIYPDQMAPVIRLDDDGARIMQQMRWGFPPPPTGNRPVTNVRNTSSTFWRSWLKPSYRCLVPATSFCEYSSDQPKVPHWFALNPNRPLFAFAGIWRPWNGVRGKEEGEHILFSILTTDANEMMQPIHPAAMPVILNEDDAETWLNAPREIAVQLQHPSPESPLSIVATGMRKDTVPEAVPVVECETE
jgi:putative SOS response-associated peptidase YedK